jgi:hypothetical protein
MNSFLLNWAMFIFMVGLLLSLPLGAVYYLNNPQLKGLFSNPRKLKAAHLDYIMQSFSIGLVIILEILLKVELPVFVVVPLAFGTFCNPFIFLLEATPLYQRGITKTVYKVLKGLSPSALFFAWFAVTFTYLPAYISWLMLGFTLMLVIAFLINRNQIKIR